ncbi:Uncharacterised protein [Bordetella pertussis]|nr:Uncharacterised protein [Bordetella pertussis]CFO08213.1 Uncharacterised protein [Bordetella pertussis]CFO25995.1 Uncharacterised protein [Bordetella pertussis]CFO69378.1 Uncharacterised protein [Bordetella pertussis]CFP12818.1 Uncharacterised protein [Bordetella pertussis]
MTARKGCTMRTSEPSVLSALSRAVMNAMTRNMLKSSLAAMKLALNTAVTPLTMLPPKAMPTSNVPSRDGTTTLARKIIVITMTTTPSRYIQCAAVMTTCWPMTTP